MSYPSIDDEDFYNKITKKYNKYEIPKKRKSFKQICFPQEYKLQMPQQFLAKYIHPNTPYKGVIIFHRIGAGKTCTAVNIGEQWKNERKIIVVTPASLVGNFRDELRSPCAGNFYISNNNRKKLRTLHPSSSKYKDIISKSNEKINKYYKIFSYNKFISLAEEGNMNLRNSLLIIDEIQNMVSEKGKYYKVLYDLIHNAPESLRIVLLSATPMFDKPNEIALTMNLLRIPFELPTGKEFEKTFIDTKITPSGNIKYNVINLDIFKERIKGFVSYYKGAPEIAFPSYKIRYIKCEMSDFQYRSYLSILSKENRKQEDYSIMAFRKGNILDIPNSFYIGTRMISNIAFPNRDTCEVGYDSFQKKHLELDNLYTYSTKFYTIVKRIKNSWGPIIVYSNFKEYGGIKSFLKVLNTQGYRNYEKYGEGKRRYAVWSGDTKNNVKNEIKAVFNQLENYDGSKMKIIILSPSAKEGVSFFNVQQIHLLDPYWNMSRIQQIIGRGIRYCSHKHLPKEKRHVKVYIYLAVHQNETETIDEYIVKLANKKSKLIEEFSNAMKESAIDCKLFKYGNYLAGDKNIQCEK